MKTTERSHLKNTQSSVNVGALIENQYDPLEIVNTKHAQLKTIPYPKHVLFIIANEFCERFNFYGMRGKH